VRGMDPEEFERLKYYGTRYCAPWDELWSRTFLACQDRLVTPKWCDSDDEQVLIDHVPFVTYVETLAAAIPESADPLVRGNIMEVIADRMNSEALRDFPTQPLDLSIAGALAAYLKDATADEVIRIAEPICGATFGHGKRIPAEFVAYRDRPGGMTDDQRCALTAILMRKERWTCGTYSGGWRKKDEEQLDAERHALEARVLTPSNIAFLMRRIDAYYGLEKEGDCANTFRFLELDRREGRDDDGWIRTCESINKGLRILDWQVNRMLGFGNRVKVYIRIDKEELKGPTKGQTSSRVWEDYWVFEDETWNYGLGVAPKDWNDRKAVEIQLPPRGLQDPSHVDAP
jgi:hypothetical protein